MPFGFVRSVTITPDEETGIGSWAKEDLIAHFKYFAASQSQTMNPDSMNYNTMMPWTSFAGMTEEDLGVINVHLRTLSPVKHKVERFTPLKKK
jgi:hypothetical protein